MLSNFSRYTGIHSGKKKTTNFPQPCHTSTLYKSAKMRRSNHHSIQSNITMNSLLVLVVLVASASSQPQFPRPGGLLQRLFGNGGGPGEGRPDLPPAKWYQVDDDAETCGNVPSNINEAGGSPKDKKQLMKTVCAGVSSQI